MADIRLIATDLDGTVLGDASGMASFAAFGAKLAELRARQNVVWVISTGRSMRSFRQVFNPMQMMELHPDYVILKHALIFGVTRWGFVPHRFWNLWVRYRVWIDRVNVRREMKRWHEMLVVGGKGVKTMEKKASRLCVRFQTEEAAAAAAALLQRKAAAYHHLQVFRYLREVDVRPVPFTKGLAVAELSEHLGLTPDQVLTIGDGHNDVSMFDPAVARMCGCPSNAAPETMQCVSERGGHIARKAALSGVLEVIGAFDGGQVCSELPAEWKDPAVGKNPHTVVPKHKKKPRDLRRLKNIVLVVLVVNASAVAFASFGYLPFSEEIMKPYRLLERLLAKLIAWGM